MATDSELQTALVNADKAGDTDGAKTLAGEIQRRRSVPTAQVPSAAHMALFNSLEALDAPSDLLHALDQTNKSPMEARAKAVNQLFMSAVFPNTAWGSFGDNWQTAKDAFASDKFGPVKNISDVQFHNKIKERIDLVNETMAKMEPGHPFHNAVQVLGMYGKAGTNEALKWFQETSKPFVQIPRAPDLSKYDPYFAGATAMGGLSPSLIAGTWNSIAPVAEGLESWQGLITGGSAVELKALANSGPAAKTAIAGMEGLFAGIFARNAIKGYPEAKKVLSDPNSTFQEKVQAVGAGVANSLVAVGASFSALESLGLGKVLGVLKGQKPAQAVETLQQAAFEAKTPEEKQAIMQAAETLHDHAGAIPPELPEQVKSAAIKDSDGVVHEGLAHPVIDAKGKEGFTTTDGRFVDRKEAADIAKTQGQVPADFKNEELHAQDVGGPNLDPEFIGIQEGLPGKIPDMELFNLNEQLGPHPAGSTVARTTLEKYGYKVTKGEDGAYSYEKPAEAKKAPEAVDIGKRDSSVSTGNGVPTEFEKKMLEEWKSQIKEQGGKTFGMTNAEVDSQLDKMGLPKAEHGEAVTAEGERQKAMATLKADPMAGAKLVDELEKKPRPLTSEEDLLMVAELARTGLARDTAEEAYQAALTLGDHTAIAETQVARARARDAYQRTAEMDTLAGTSNAQGLALRAARLNEDYSLANMEKRLADENPDKKLTKEQEELISDINKRLKKTQKAVDDYEAKRLKALKARTEKATEELKGKLEKGDLSAKPKREPVQLDEEAIRLKAEHKRVRDEFDTAVIKARLASRTPLEKTMDALPKWRRGFLLSGPATLVKLIAAAGARAIETPVVEAVSSAVGALPGISKVKGKAARYSGLNVQAEARAITEGVTTGMEDAWFTLKTGRSNLDVLYGKDGRISESDVLPRAMTDFFAQVHGALKAPVKRAEFSRSFEKRIQAVIESGGDPHHPMVQTRLAMEAYKDSQRAIFMQDNAVVDAYKRALSRFDQVEKDTKKPTFGNRGAGTALRAALPIVKVPTNLVGETFEYATGLATGSVRLASALRKGTENLSTDQADLIMRQLSKGSIGAGAFLLGYFNPNVVGGYYQGGEKRKPGDPRPLSIKIYGVNIPSLLLHNPLLETLQIGATVRRVADSKLRKKDKDSQGIDNGLWAGALGLIEETPFAREAVEYTKLFNPQERGKAKADLAKGFAVPAIVDEAARKLDTDAQGNTVPRKAEGVMQGIESGIPGLREDLPVRNIKKRRRGEP